MKKYEAQWVPSPINLPEGKSGRMQVKHKFLPVGEEVMIVSARQGILRGVRPVRGVVQGIPLRIHQLLEDRKGHTGLWMSDIPEELNQIEEMLHTVQPEGRVLIGGLGLGILAARVAQLENVSHVTVVEKSRDVIKLCAKKGLYETKCMDIGKFLNEHVDQYDYYLLDTWAGTNEGTWWDEVMPLRRTIRRRFGMTPEVHGWAEDMMWGQIYRALTHHTTPHWFYTYLPIPMTPYEAEVFLNTVGTPSWEKKYGKGIDQYIAESETRRKKA